MDVSRFLFKQETKEKLQKETRLSVGKVRWEKLKELETNGKLATAKDRRDIVELLGYDRENAAVYYWVSDKIKKHYLVEQPTNVADESQYYTTGKEPDYDAHSQAVKMWEGRKAKRKQPREEQPRKQMKLSTSFRNTRLSRFNAIKQLQDSGEIAKMTTRRELCEAIKVPYAKARGWMSNMVTTGFINEANPWETPRYSLTQKALKEIATPLRTVEVHPQPKTAILKPLVAPATPTYTTIATKQFGLAMTVHYGDLTIEFKGITQETIDRLIDKLTSKSN